MLWPLVFLLPLGMLAGQMCSVHVVDPLYHSLLWLHERLVPILVVLAIISIAGAAYRFVRVQESIRLLLSLAVEPPDELNDIFGSEMRAHHSDAELLYIDVNSKFCFTIFHGPSIIVSHGFVEGLSREELSMVAKHEVLHVLRRDPWRSIAWHLFFAGLVLPGFDPLETFLHLRREHVVDGTVVRESASPEAYKQLLLRCSRRRDRAHGAICTSGIAINAQSRDLEQMSLVYLLERSFPALVSVTTIGLVLFSHELFMTSLPYLQAHHC